MSSSDNTNGTAYFIKKTQLNRGICIETQCKSYANTPTNACEMPKKHEFVFRYFAQKSEIQQKSEFSFPPKSEEKVQHIGATEIKTLTSYSAKRRFRAETTIIAGIIEATPPILSAVILDATTIMFKKINISTTHITARLPKDYTSSIKRNIENLSLIREICVFIGTL